MQRVQAARSKLEQVAFLPALVFVPQGPAKQATQLIW